MSDFSHLKASKKDTAEFVFFEVVGEPTLTVKHAGESNKPFFNEKLKVAERYRQRKAKISLDMIRDNRERDRELFPKHVVLNWKNVKDVNGTPVVFSPTECEAFLRALDDDMFDALREFCSDASNFRDTADAAAAMGNSQTV